MVIQPARWTMETPGIFGLGDRRQRAGSSEYYVE